MHMLPLSSGFSARVSRTTAPGSFRIATASLGLTFVLGLAGCQREEVQSYTVRKDPPRVDAHAGHDHSEDEAHAPATPPKPRPQLSWTLPTGWTESGAGQMSIASFAIKGDGGAEAQVTITPLAKLGGRDAQIVNMWREQVGLEALAPDEALKQFEKVTVGPDEGSLFQIEGKPKSADDAYQIVTAMVHREEASWFYKLAGNTALVTAQKPAFIAFLKSIRLTPPAETAAAPASSPAVTPPTDSGGASPKWTVPAAWKQVSAGAMQLARFGVPEVNGAKAEASVSVFPNDTGGTLANVNRWRGQVGLEPATEATLGSNVAPLDGAGAGAIFIELKGPQKMIYGAVVPRAGSYWFYKLLGDAAAVAPQKDAFVAFAKSKP